MDTNQMSGNKQSAVKEMVRKLDNKVGGNGGYITNAQEISDILSELSPFASFSISEKAQNSTKNVIAVEIKIEFAMDRSLV